MNSNLILENGQFFMQKQPGTKNMQMYVGDGVTALSSLSPVGLLPDALSRMIFIHNKEEGLQIPIVITDEDGNVVFPGVPISGGSGSGGSGGTGGSVGEIKSFIMETPPAGWLECDGSQLEKKDYPDLYDCLNTLSDKSYIIDNDNFTIPDMRDEFLRGRGIARLVGTRQVDALQNITGNAFIGGGGLGTIGLFVNSAGAFYVDTPGSTYNSAATSVTRQAMLHIDASRVARTDVETRPLNIATLFCIKY